MKLKIILFSVAVILLAGCQPPSNAQLTETAQVTKISGAETLVASLSQTPQVTETPTATPSPTPTLTPTMSTTPTQNSVYTLTPTPASTTTDDDNTTVCDRVTFVDDISVPDGTEMSPGETFTKTWRLQNTGTCTWTTEYTAQFLNGIEMGGETTPIDPAVEPGTTLDLTIEFVAPQESGVYASEWAIANQNGITFAESFYVQIEVTDNSAATQTP